MLYPGLYEQVINNALNRELAEIPEARKSTAPIDTAEACRALGIHPIAVTAGYMSAEAWPDFYAAMDAANIDLKGFTEEFYWKVTGTHLADVLETIDYATNEARTPEGEHVWVELTTLLIPGLNDDDAQLHAECTWIREHLGPDVPLHFSAFHPSYRMMDVPPPPYETLTRARDIALEEGLNYVYTGNVHDREGDTTYCPNPECRAKLVERDWYRIIANCISVVEYIGLVRIGVSEKALQMVSTSVHVFPSFEVCRMIAPFIMLASNFTPATFLLLSFTRCQASSSALSKAFP